MWYTHKWSLSDNILTSITFDPSSIHDIMDMISLQLLISLISVTWFQIVALEIVVFRNSGFKWLNNILNLSKFRISFSSIEHPPLSWINQFLQVSQQSTYQLCDSKGRSIHCELVGCECQTYFPYGSFCVISANKSNVYFISISLQLCKYK